MDQPDPRERDRRVAELLHDLDHVKARPSQFSAAYLRRLLTQSRDEIYVLVTDLRGWERRESDGAGSS